MAVSFSTVDEYAAALPEDARTVLGEVRRIVARVVPGVGETISYRMPTFVLDGRPLVHAAAWKKHLGLYPLPPMDGELAGEVEPYRGAKDAMQLRYDRPVPYDLVERVVAVLLERRRAATP
ncbi:iron chaperone [Blastococcus litoris]|uniref:iron chaperone n=1 Tax=Blastococcus litoris TaxID=2171622 RepID=UPI000E30934D|nr:DUF1801 domain-containing protein [Blastococcus litoris]